MFRKILLLIVFLSAVMTISLVSPKSTFADCQGYANIPMTVSPTSGDQNTDYDVTLGWDKIKNDLNTYAQSGHTVEIGIFEGQNAIPFNTGGIDKLDVSPFDYSNPNNVKPTKYTITGISIASGTHQLAVHVYIGGFGDTSCTVETPATTITVNSTVTQQGSGPIVGISTKPGDPCDPNSSNQCQSGTSCLPQTNSTTGNYVCMLPPGKECDPKIPNQCGPNMQCVAATTNIATLYVCAVVDPISSPPPLPPCKEGLDKNGTKTQIQKDIITCLTVDTAIGAINTNPAGFVTSIFSLLLGISGGVALILIIISGYRLMASQGNPEQVQGAREMLTSAIVGLLFIIFSFVILQVIGVNILHIPGFG